MRNAEEFSGRRSRLGRMPWAYRRPGAGAGGRPGSGRIRYAHGGALPRVEPYCTVPPRPAGHHGGDMGAGSAGDLTGGRDLGPGDVAARADLAAGDVAARADLAAGDVAARADLAAGDVAARADLGAGTWSAQAGAGTWSAQAGSGTRPAGAGTGTRPAGADNGAWPAEPGTEAWLAGPPVGGRHGDLWVLVCGGIAAAAAFGAAFVASGGVASHPAAPGSTMPAVVSQACPSPAPGPTP